MKKIEIQLIGENGNIFNLLSIIRRTLKNLYRETGDEEYETAYRLGKLIGKTGFNVCSGGFQGIMDAVSKGVTENGGDAIGVTVNLFSADPSKYLTKEIKCNSLFSAWSKIPYPL